MSYKNKKFIEWSNTNVLDWVDDFNDMAPSQKETLKDAIYVVYADGQTLIEAENADELLDLFNFKNTESEKQIVSQFFQKMKTLLNNENIGINNNDNQTNGEEGGYFDIPQDIPPPPPPSAPLDNEPPAPMDEIASQTVELQETNMYQQQTNEGRTNESGNTGTTNNGSSEIISFKMDGEYHTTSTIMDTNPECDTIVVKLSLQNYHDSQNFLGNNIIYKLIGLEYYKKPGFLTKYGLIVEKASDRGPPEMAFSNIFEKFYHKRLVRVTCLPKVDPFPTTTKLQDRIYTEDDFVYESFPDDMEYELAKTKLIDIIKREIILQHDWIKVSFVDDWTYARAHWILIGKIIAFLLIFFTFIGEIMVLVYTLSASQSANNVKLECLSGDIVITNGPYVPYQPPPYNIPGYNQYGNTAWCADEMNKYINIDKGLVYSTVIMFNVSLLIFLQIWCCSRTKQQKEKNNDCIIIMFIFNIVLLMVYIIICGFQSFKLYQKWIDDYYALKSDYDGTGNLYNQCSFFIKDAVNKINNYPSSNYYQSNNWEKLYTYIYATRFWMYFKFASSIIMFIAGFIWMIIQNLKGGGGGGGGGNCQCDCDIRGSGSGGSNDCDCCTCGEGECCDGCCDCDCDGCCAGDCCGDCNCDCDCGGCNCDCGGGCIIQ